MDAMNVFLAVDANIDVYERERVEWARHGISASRVDNMPAAISLLSRGGEFLFVAINEDSISDLSVQLRIMRDVTEIPIFIFTSNYTVEKKCQMIDCGADGYESFNDYASDNVLSALAFLKAQNRWIKKTKPLPLLIQCDVILSPSRRKVFVKNVEVFLTKKEFDILHCLMAGNGRVLTHTELLQEVWGDEYDGYETNVLWRTIDRLRNKLYAVSPEAEYIKVERGVGYKFVSH